MRTKRAKLRTVDPDPIYHSTKVTKLINRVMKHGKKSVARKQVYDAFELIKAKTKKNPLDLFETAVQNITPQMEVRSRRVGGAAYQVPAPVKAGRGFNLAVRWLVIEASKRPNSSHRSFADKIAAELIDAASGEGGAIQRKETSHKMAEANKAFAHFRW
jgi:small subunit ribosomal protein S7